MPVKSQEYDNVCVISIEGDYAAAELETTRKYFEQRIVSRRMVDYVIDLEKCGFIDSEGLEQLLWMKRKCEDLMGQIKLVAAGENLGRILHLTRLALRFESHADLSSALKAMR